MENYINGKLFDKNMKFGILVDHDLSNDILYYPYLLIYWYKSLRRGSSYIK